MNRTPVLGAPVRAVATYADVPRSHSNVLPTTPTGNSAAVACTLICGLSRAKVQAVRMRRAYGSRSDVSVSGMTALTSERDGKGAGAVVRNDGKFAENLR